MTKLNVVRTPSEDCLVVNVGTWQVTVVRAPDGVVMVNVDNPKKDENHSYVLGEAA